MKRFAFGKEAVDVSERGIAQDVPHTEDFHGQSRNADVLVTTKYVTEMRMTL
jgi:hypothetical protein